VNWFLLVFALVFSVERSAYGYPELVRHGYVNCTSCHFSPSGGGILNGYGRVQAEEVLSAWSREGDGGLLHGLVPSTEPVSFGGQFRALQMRSEDATATSARFILMQADAEAAIQWRQFQLVGTAGVQDLGGARFLSRRHYLIYRHTEQSPWLVRVGRFQPNVGINMADHAIATKMGVGLGQGTESYNIEGAWLGENFDAFVTAIFGRPGEDRERGFALRSSLNLGDRSKLGLSYYFGTKSDSTRNLFGPYAILGFTERFFLLTEIYLQAYTTNATGSAFGPASYARLNYECFKGIHAYLTGELSRTNASRPWYGAFGVGTQIFPMPHFELRAEYNKRQDSLTAGNYADYAWLMFHYYL
jgi:hypothetical protein